MWLANILFLAVLIKNSGDVAVALKETLVQKIVRLTAKRFSSSQSDEAMGNNLHSISSGPLQFETRVDIEEVVRFILAKRNAMESARRKKAYPGNDARDISYTSGLLKPLSSQALDEIEHLGRGDIHRHLREKTYPFSRLNKETREKLLHLPNSWVHEGAHWQLNFRRSKTACYRQKLDRVRKMMEERFA